MALLAGGWFAFVAASLVDRADAEPAALPRATLKAWCVTAPLAGVVDHVLGVPPSTPHAMVLRWAMLAIAVAAGVAWWKRDALWPLAGALGLVAIARILVLWISPNPPIDVFATATSAADHFLAGRNPYLQEYADIYEGRFDYPPAMVYWPLVLYVESLGRALAGDIRVGFIAAEAALAWALARLLGEAGWSLRDRLWAILAWSVFPVASLVLEYAWIDPLLTTALALALVALRRERPLILGLCLGAAVAAKQYGAFGALIFAPVIVRQLGVRGLLKTAAAGAAVLLVTLGPFLVVSRAAFLNMTMTIPAAVGIRLNSLSLLVPVAEHLTGPWPVRVSVGAPLAAMVGIMAWLWRRPASPSFPASSSSALLSGLAIVYGATFLFGKQAYCNYFHMLTWFIFASASLAARPAAGRATRTP